MNSLFKPVEWSYNTNIYEVNLRQYSPEGSFKVFAQHLERLRDMGIETLWFMPVTPISREKRKGSLGSYYACSAYTDTNPEFGSVDDFKVLVRQARELGFKVLIDWVANHTGVDHHWTKEHPDFYLHDENGRFYDTHGWDDVIDLNYYNSEMRRAMIDAMKFWVDECNIDGFRADMAHLVPLDFWRDARKELDSIKALFWLAECELPAYHEVFDASYTWNWMHKTEEFYKGLLKLADLKKFLLSDISIFPQHALRCYFTSNHDENSWNGTEYEKYGPTALAFAVFSCTWNSIPLIYSGQEVPNRKRLSFFDKDPIDWSGQLTNHEFYKKLLRLRKSNDALKAGDPRAFAYLLQTTADEQVLAFLRKKHEEEVLVLLNLSGTELQFNITDNFVSGKFSNLFTGEVEDSSSFKMLPWEYRVLVK